MLVEKSLAGMSRDRFPRLLRAGGRAAVRGRGEGGNAASQRNLHPHGRSRFLPSFAVLVLEAVARFAFFLNGKQEESVLFDVWN